MTTVSIDDVQHLATLSGLQLTDMEVEKLRQDLENILGYIEQLRKLDTSGVEPTYQVTGLTNVWREDEIQPGLTREELLALAPDTAGSNVKVPQVL